MHLLIKFASRIRAGKKRDQNKMQFQRKKMFMKGREAQNSCEVKTGKG